MDSDDDCDLCAAVDAFLLTRPDGRPSDEALAGKTPRENYQAGVDIGARLAGHKWPMYVMMTEDDTTPETKGWTDDHRGAIEHLLGERSGRTGHFVVVLEADGSARIRYDVRHIHEIAERAKEETLPTCYRCSVDLNIVKHKKGDCPRWRHPDPTPDPERMSKRLRISGNDELADRIEKWAAEYKCGKDETHRPGIGLTPEPEGKLLVFCLDCNSL